MVDFIFSKDASIAKHDTLLVEDKSKTIPSCIKHLINDGFYYPKNWMSQKGGMSKIMATVDVIPLWPFP